MQGTTTFPDYPYRALANARRRAILEAIATDGRIERPRDTAAHHVHIPFLVEADLVAIDDPDYLTAGERFDEVIHALAG